MGDRWGIDAVDQGGIEEMAKKIAKKIAKKDAKPFEGRVRVVNIKGRDSEASHQCLFGMVSATNLPSEAFRLDPFQPVKKYRALLRQLVDACLDQGFTTVDSKPARDTPFAVRIATLQDGGGKPPRNSSRKPDAGDVWSFIGKVTCMDAGTNTVRSSFTLHDGDASADFVLDSTTNPKRAAAMFDVIAAAFGAGATLKVNDYVARGKRIAAEIEMGPLA
jgi:hypothetical protein